MNQVKKCRDFFQNSKNKNSGNILLCFEWRTELNLKRSLLGYLNFGVYHKLPSAKVISNFLFRSLSSPNSDPFLFKQSNN